MNMLQRVPPRRLYHCLTTCNQLMLSFPQVNKATMNMLQRVEPYVAYGYPNLKTVKVN